jgi:stage V sporulation protein AA
MTKVKVYIDLNKKITVNTDTKVKIKDVGEVFCEDDKILIQVKNLVIYKSKSEEDWDFITTIDLANKLFKFNPNLDPIILGAQEVMFEIKSKELGSKGFQIFKVVFVSIILFFGAGIAVINFHEDVNMSQSLEKIYYTFTGIKATNPLAMTIPYTIGLGLGVFTFFSRIISTSRRRRKQPGPMEIEQYLYDQDMEEYILNSLKNKKEKIKKV